MNSTIHQRLHGIRLFEDPTDVEQLSPYFYIPGLIEEKAVDPRVENIVVEPCIEKPKQKTMRPLPPDSLFWNIFIHVYGEGEFFNIGSKFTNREWEEKNMIRTFFTTKPKELQTTNHKITLGNIKEMMSEYMVSTSTTLLGIIGLSVYYKLSIILVDPEKRTHLSFLPMNTDKETLILIKNRGKGKAPDHYEVGDDIKDTFGLASYIRPLRAISTYKRSDLEEIAELVKIDSGNKSKDELYRTLSEQLVWK
jgi:hypothetical protein